MVSTAKSNSKKLIFIFIYFFFQTATFAQTQKGADIDGEAASDLSGWSVSMPDANTVAIGAPYNDGTNSDAGHVRIYSWNGLDWVQKGTDIDGEASFDNFGFSVSMPDENTVAIGAQLNDGTASNAGHVRIYSWDGSNWVKKGDDIDGEAANDQSGFSVNMPDENTVAIGANRNNGKGHVRIYTWNGSNWTQKGIDIDAEGVATNLIGQSGYSVSMPDENTVAIGDIANSGNNGYADAGHVRIYNWSGSAWTQKGTDIDGDTSFVQSGYSVSMPNKNTVAIAAPFQNGRKGKVKIYKWNGSDWIQNGINIDGEAFFDQSGYSICMPDENTVAIGAQLNDGTAFNAGHVRVYSLCKNSTETINRAACYSYVSPSKKYTYTKTDTYYDTIPNANGCDSVITINLTINSADVSVTNSSPTLTANATGAIYQWLSCDSNFAQIDSANKQIFFAASNGNYAVEVTQNGCIDTSLCINVSNANILENTFGYQLKVFPNPTKDEVTIELGNHYNEVSVIIRNALGQEVMRTSFNKTNTFKLTIPGEPSLYMLELHAPEHKALLRVLKN